jgi:hypothetical protein
LEVEVERLRVEVEVEWRGVRVEVEVGRGELGGVGGGRWVFFRDLACNTVCTSPATLPP